MGDAEMRDEAVEPEVKPIAPGTFGFGFPGNVSRRALLAGGGAAALTALLAACGDDDDSVTATTGGAHDRGAGDDSRRDDDRGVRDDHGGIDGDHRVGHRDDEQGQHGPRGDGRHDHARAAEPPGAVRRSPLRRGWPHLPAAVGDQRHPVPARRGRPVRAGPGHRVRDQRRQADVDVHVARRRHEPGRHEVHGRRREDGGRPHRRRRRLHPPGDVQVVRHRRHRRGRHPRPGRDEQALRHARQ